MADLIVVGIFAWLGWRVFLWLWPYIKFTAVFIGALVVIRAVFFLKDVSYFALITGIVGVVVAAYNYAKSKV